MRLPAYLIYVVNIAVAITCTSSIAGCLLHVLPVCILHCLGAENYLHAISPHCWYLLHQCLLCLTIKQT